VLFDKKLLEMCDTGNLISVEKKPDLPILRKRSHPTDSKQEEVASDSYEIYSGNASAPKIIQGQSTTSMLEIANHGDVTPRTCKIDMIQLGLNRMQPWYFSPYPKEFSSLECLYLCEFCLQPFGSSWSLARHECKCELHHPPGSQVYNDGNVSFFEVDGIRNRTYAENLCLLSKLFLEHKAVRFDTSPFMFYVMTELRGEDHHIVGYFSKEKKPPHDYNLSCILVLPVFQRRGYGRFLIEFSYELSMMQGKNGTPEAPLSYFGRVTYENYWYEKIIETILENINASTASQSNVTVTISVQEICDRTGIKREDILYTMKLKGMRTDQQDEDVFYLSSEAIKSFKKSRKKRRVEFSESSLKISPRHLQLLYQ